MRQGRRRAEAGSDPGNPKRVTRVEENTAAHRVELSTRQIEWLSNITTAADEGNIAVIDR
jgi:hypothetical protein